MIGTVVTSRCAIAGGGGRRGILCRSRESGRSVCCVATPRIRGIPATRSQPSDSSRDLSNLRSRALYVFQSAGSIYREARACVSCSCVDVVTPQRAYLLRSLARDITAMTFFLLLGKNRSLMSANNRQRSFVFTRGFTLLKRGRAVVETVDRRP